MGAKTISATHFWKTYVMEKDQTEPVRSCATNLSVILRIYMAITTEAKNAHNTRVTQAQARLDMLRGTHPAFSSGLM